MSKLVIPGELRFLKGLRYANLSLIDFNSFELEDVLPGLFYLIRYGRQRGRGAFSEFTTGEMASRLASDTAHFDGLSSDDAKAVLEAWLKTSVLRMASRGRNEKVLSVRPLHFLSYRSDLPTGWSNLRSVPEFIAGLLHREDNRSEDTFKPDRLFGLRNKANLFCRTFGIGLGSEEAFALEAGQDHYTDSEPLDIESLLLVRLMEGVSPPNPIAGKHGEIKPFQPLCLWEAKRFREDFSLLLRCYTPASVPPRVLGDYVLALLSLNLTIYFITHCLSANALYRNGSVEPDKLDNGNRRWEPAIFVDLTDGRNRKARELARLGYQRHVRIMMEQLRTMVGLRILERVLSNAKHLPEVRAVQSNESSTIDRLEMFAKARFSSDSQAYHTVQAFASAVINQLEEFDPANREFFGSAALSLDSLSPFDRLIEAIVLSDSELSEHLLRFHTSVARLGHHTSILARPTARRLDSYYTLTSGMLEMLIHLVPLKGKRGVNKRTMDVYEFVNELRVRYGIWIDQPPPGLDDSIEAHQAAKANMDALKEKLRQLGALRAVTDARGMQWLIPRYETASPDLSQTE
jgi:hypothetical protein